jgi:hypothetical protein
MKTYTVRLHGVHRHPVFGDIPLFDIHSGTFRVTVNQLRRSVWQHPSSSRVLSQDAVDELKKTYPVTVITEELPRRHRERGLVDRQNGGKP